MSRRNEIYTFAMLSPSLLHSLLSSGSIHSGPSALGLLCSRCTLCALFAVDRVRERAEQNVASHWNTQRQRRIDNHNGRMPAGASLPLGSVAPSVFSSPPFSGSVVVFSHSLQALSVPVILSSPLISALSFSSCSLSLGISLRSDSLRSDSLLTAAVSLNLPSVRDFLSLLYTRGREE